MACIYHIYSSLNPRMRYIGQTKNDILKPVYNDQSSAAGDRPLDHFVGLYRHYSEPDFVRLMRKYPLNSMCLEIYDEANDFGLSQGIYDEFFRNGSIEGFKPELSLNTISQGNNPVIQISTAKKNSQRSYYLDVAELLHISYFYSQGYDLLNHKGGGQHYSFISSKGQVINNTLSPAQIQAMLAAPSEIIGAIQSAFSKNIQEYFHKRKLNLVPLKGAKAGNYTMIEGIARSAANSGSQKTGFHGKEMFNSTIFKNTIILYFQDYAKAIRDVLDKTIQNFPNASIIIEENMKNIYSAFSDKFQASYQKRGNYSSFLDLMRARLGSKKFESALQKKYNNGATVTQLIEEIGDGLVQDINENTTLTFGEQISVFEMFDINVNGHQLDLFMGNKPASSGFGFEYSISMGSMAADADFKKSLQGKSYYFFYNVANICLASLSNGAGSKVGSPIIFNDKAIQIVHMARLDEAIYNYYEQMHLEGLTPEYGQGLCHTGLSIYTQHRQETPLGNSSGLGGTLTFNALPPVQYFGFIDTPYTMDMVNPMNDLLNTDEKAYTFKELEPIYLAYEFSQKTYTDILFYKDLPIDSNAITYY